MNKYYFTFGTSPKFPYGEKDFVEVTARTMYESEQRFREAHPDRTPGCLNCAFVYTEAEFNQIRSKYYGNVEPVEELSAEGMVLSDRDEAIVKYELSEYQSVEAYMATLSESDREKFCKATGMPWDKEEEDALEMA